MSTAENIRELAYRLWEERGRTDGHAQDDWLEAERQILSGPFQTLSPSRDSAPDVGGPAVVDAVSRGPRKRTSSSAPRPTTPLDEAESTQREAPKVGSRDAPGG